MRINVGFIQKTTIVAVVDGDVIGSNILVNDNINIIVVVVVGGGLSPNVGM